MNELQYTRVLMDAVAVKMNHLELTLKEQICEDEFYLYSEQLQEIIAYMQITKLKMNVLGQMIDEYLKIGKETAKDIYDHEGRV